MSANLIGSNVVIAARQFNPSVFSQIWLIRNEILAEEDFQQKNCLFSEEVVKIESNRFGLLVVPPQLQFVPRVKPEEQGEVVSAALGTIVRLLPHTPYIAVGLNLIWHILPEDHDAGAYTRSLFYVPDRSLSQAFDVPDARFGAYYSKNTVGCRMKLDVKPISWQTETGTEEVLQFAFNFHLDVPDQEPLSAIEHHLNRWNEANEEAARIVHDVAE